MSSHLTREHIEALKSRLATARRTTASEPDDLGAISVAYWRDRALRAEARAEAAEARMEGLLAALSALRLESVVGTTAVDSGGGDRGIEP